MRNHLLWLVGVLAAGCGSSPARPLALSHVVLYRNGIGHFERAGHVEGNHFRLSLQAREVDDVIKTLTVVDLGPGKGRTVSAVLPSRSAGNGPVNLDITLSGAPHHDLVVSYAVPTPIWKTTYRIALPEPGGHAALLQSWAIVANATDQAWQGVRLTLASGAPLSFATDLRTPRYVDRPRADGELLSAGATGPVLAERTGASDRDGDGLPDAIDRCPDEAEDRDGFQDSDGCPEADNDHDGIPDVSDKCPDDSETANGMQDEDGCPDRGRVLVQANQLQIIERISFARGSDVLGPGSAPILDAMAAVLRGHPEVHAVAIAGHASEDEAEPWALAARRAAAVQAALVSRGVATRFELRPFGASQPLDDSAGEAGQARNRRVELDVLPSTTPPAEGPASTRRLQASVRASVLPTDVAGMVRYQLADPVSVPRGAETLVSIINQSVPGEDVYLYRPEAQVPGSDSYPLRAARIVNASGLMLEGGTVAIFARGGFVGEGLLGRLHEDETSFIPYALDGSTSVRVEANDGEEPVRLTSLSRGVLTVENAAVHTTRYEIRAGRQTPARLFVRLPRRAGYHAVGLPPGSETTADALIVPVPLTRERTSRLVIREETAVTREISLADGDPEALAAYLTGSALAPALAQRLSAAVAVRKELAQRGAELARLRRGLGDSARRIGELQGSLRTIEKMPGAGPLRAKLLARLGEATTQSEDLSRKLATGNLAESEARDRLSAAIEELSLEPLAMP